MDEPTSGLDARSAAVVMRAVKNVAETGRKVVCTIHQPSIDIFEAFDELILLKSGGKIIYSGALGDHSSSVIEYFESISGVPKITDNCNPATWMMEVTSTTMEMQLSIDFSRVYSESSLYKYMKELVQQLRIPPSNSKDLHFPTRFSQNGWEQFKACLWKQNLSYWRSPYNLRRIGFVAIIAFTFGALFWKHARILNNQQDLFNILGSMYLSIINIGRYNDQSVLPFTATERAVMYREKFAGMYSSWTYSVAQAAIEIPYVFLQILLLMITTYPAIGYYWTASKVLLFFYTAFCTLLYYVYLGMLLVSLTPNVQMASILASFFNIVQSLFSGYVVPAPQIPKWWIWLYHLTPTSWTLNALSTSQYGDIDKEIEVFGQTKSVSTFLEEYFGFRHNQLGLVAALLIIFPVAFVSLFALAIEKLNFQRR